MDENAVHADLNPMLLNTDPPSSDHKKITGADMSIPQPITVDVNSTMSVDDYKKCSMIMSICQTMVQSYIIDGAKIHNIEKNQSAEEYRRLGGSLHDISVHVLLHFQGLTK